MNLISRFLVVFLLSLFLSGCVLVPWIDSYKKIGVSEGDRQRLLQERVLEFQRAVYWGRPEAALAFVDPEVRDDLWRVIRARGDREKIVDSKVEFVKFEENSYSAEVDVAVKYYRVPYYVVQERVERQQWNFTISDGWRYSAMELVELDELTAPGAFG